MITAHDEVDDDDDEVVVSVLPSGGFVALPITMSDLHSERDRTASRVKLSTSVYPLWSIQSRNPTRKEADVRGSKTTKLYLSRDESSRVKFSRRHDHLKLDSYANTDNFGIASR